MLKDFMKAQNFVRAVVAAFALVCALMPASAFAVNAGITYHGRLVEPDNTTPVSGIVQFVIQVRTPDASNCLMYEETKSVDLTGTNGVFALTIGDGTGTRTDGLPPRTDGSGLTIDTLFANRGTFNFNASGCTGATSYTPAAGDGRILAVTFQSSSMSAPEPMPNQTLNYAPYALESLAVGGFQATDLVRFQDSAGAPIAMPVMNATEASALQPLLDGTSGLYAKPGDANNGTPIYATAAPSGITSTNVGDMWLDTSGGVGNDVLKINTDSGVKTIGLSSTGFINTITAGTGITATTASGVATIGIAAGGVGTTELAASAVTDAKIAAGTITGDKLDPNIGIATTSSVSAANLSARSIGIFNSLNDSVTLTAPSGAFTNYGLTFPAGQGTAGQVLTLTDATTGQLGWIAPSTGSVTSVTAAAVAGNPVVVGGTAAAPTINIPAASSTQNGYLSSTDYATFAAKLSATLASGTILVGNATNVATAVAPSGDVVMTNAGAFTVTGLQGTPLSSTTPMDGQVLVYDNASTKWQPENFSIGSLRTTLGGQQFAQAMCTSAQTLTWSSLTDTFTCANISISSTAVSGLGTAAALNVGTAAGNVVQLDSSARIPSVDGSLITNLDAGHLATGTVDPARLPSTVKFWQDGGLGRIGYIGGSVGIGTTTPTAYLQLPASSGAASSAPLKFLAGTNLTTPEIGAIEFDGTNLYYTNGSGRQTLSTGTSTGAQSFAGDVTMNGAGTGLTVTNNASVGGNVAIGGSQTVSGAQTVTGLSTLTGGLNSAGQVAITNTTASTSTTTGALTVAGGVGIGGTVNIGGAVNAPLVTSTNITTSNLTASNNILASGKVGIGTTSPLGELTIAAGTVATAPLVLTPGTNLTTPITGAIEFDGTSLYYTDSLSTRHALAASGVAGSYLPLAGGTMTGAIVNANGTAAAPSLSFSSDTTSGFYAPSAGAVGIDTNGAERVRITQAGNVGIGTTSPNYKLDVAGDINASGVFRINGTALSASGSNAWTQSGTNAYPTTATNIGIGTTSPLYPLDIAGSAHLTGDISAKSFTANAVGMANANGMYSPLANAIGLTSNSVERLRIDASGNVGIGTTAPGSLLTVAGVIQSTSGGVKFPDGTTQTTASASAANTFQQSGNAFGASAVLGTTDSNVVGIITNGTRRVTVDTSGNVGIGTTAPSQALEVVGNAKVSGGLIAGKMYPQADSVMGLQFNKANGTINVLDIDTLNARVGVGTTAPNYPLDVVGQVNSSTGFSIAGVPISAAGSSIWALNATNAYNTNAGNVGIGTDAPASPLSVNGGASIGTYAATAAPLNGLIVSGNVGIGTTSPASPLTVAGVIQSTSGGVKFPDGTTQTTAASGAANTFIQNGNAFAAPAVLGTTDSNVVGIITNGTRKMTIDTSGNVGIGTTSPAAKLNIAAGTATVAPLMLTSGTNLTTPLAGAIEFDGTNLYYTDSTAARKTLSVGGSGTYLPLAGGTMTGAIIHANGTVAAPSLSFANDTTSGLYAPSAGIVGIGTSGTERVRITQAGNVGIGTTSPASPLTVAGVIQSTSGGIKFPDGTTQTTASTGSATPSLSALSSATAINTIDSLNFAQTWNWSTAAGQTSLTMNANALTTGSILSIASASASLNSTNGLLNVANTGASTSGLVAKIQSNSTAASGLYVLASGNIGIGTTAPASPLTVAGVIQSTTGGIKFPDGTTQTTAASGAANTFIQNGNAFGAAAVLGTTDSNVVGIITGGVRRVTVDTSGNVGIGTTSPSQALDVVGSAKLSGALIAGKMYPSADGSSAIQFNKANGTTNVMDIDTTNARVGIGTTAPMYPLDVVGQINSSTGFSVAGIPISAAGSSIWALNATNAYNTNAGNVGIGTDAPASSISVAGNGSIGLGYTTTLAPTNGLIVQGNVGIGTTSPSYKLDVAGDINASGVFRINGTALSASGSNAWTQSGSNVYPTSATNIGIGTTAPVDSLSLGNTPTASATHALVNLTNTALVGASASGTYLGANPASASADLIDYQVAGVTKFLVDKNGKITGDGSGLTGVSASGTLFSGLTAAATTNTIDNTNFAQTWNWSTAAGQTPLSMNANALTTGSLLSIASSNASLNSSNGLLSVANTGASTSGLVAKIQSNSTAGSGLYVLANGKVGIGTTTPAYPLDVAGQVNATAFSIAGVPISAGSANAWALNGANLSNTNTGNVGVGTSVPVSKFDVAGGMSVGSYAGVTAAPLNGMIISGNVGIGTTSPSQALEVAGSAKLSGALIAGKMYPQADSATAIQFNKANGNTNVLDIDTTNGRVGIGTTAPSYPLDVVGQINSSTGFSIAGVPISAAGSSIWALNSTNAYNTNAGNVGIGTDAPAAKLQIAAGTATVAPLMLTSGVNLTTPLAGAIEFDGTSLYYTDSTATRRTLSIGGTGTYLPLAGGTMTGAIVHANGTAAAPSLSFANDTTSGLFAPSTGVVGIGTSGTERVRVTQAGNVGIGTTAPTSPLTVAGVIQSTSGGIKFPDGTTQTTASTGSAAPALSAISAATATNTIDNLNFAQTWNWSTAAGQTPLTMNANSLTTGSVLSIASSSASLNSTNGLLSVANTGASTSGMIARIQSNSAAGSGLSVLASGYVGIGTSAPSYQLDVVGGYVRASNFRTAGQYLATNANPAAPSFSSNISSNTGLFFPAVNNIGFAINGTESVHIDSSGNLGIGTTAPANALDIGTGGGIHITSGTPSSTTAALYNNAGTLTWNGVALNSGSPGIGGSGVTNYLPIYTAANTLGSSPVYASGGNVGIGTTAPAELLNVNGGNLRLSSSGNAGINLSTNNNYGFNYLNITANNSGNGAAFNTYPGGAGVGQPYVFQFNTSTANESALLFIGQRSLKQHWITTSNDATSGAPWDLVLRSVPDNSGWNYPGYDAVTIKAGAPSASLYLTAAGKVGIGTTAPAYKLDVNGAVNATSLLVNGVAVGAGGSSPWTTYGSNIANNNSGSVGIGTTMPAYPLDVRAQNARLAGGNNWTNLIVEQDGSNFNPTLWLRKGQGTVDSPAYSNLNDVMGAIEFGESAGYGFSALISSTATENHSGSASGGNLTFSTTSNGNSYATERLRIDQAGNVGIGTTAPAYKLDVAGSGNFQSLYVNGVAVGAGTSSPWTTSGSNVYNSNSGFVGVGTTAPGIQFDVVAPSGASGKAIRVNGGSGFGGIYAVDIIAGATQALGVNGEVNIGHGSYSDPAFGTPYDLKMGGPGNAIATLGAVSFSNQKITFGVTTGSASWIDNSGNGYYAGKVGIGTTAPANALDIATNGGIHITSGAAPASTAAALYNNGGTLYWNGTALSSGATGIGGSGTSNYVPLFSGASTIGNSPIYATGGNVGIGTTAPGYKLDVAGAVNATSLLINGVAVGTGGSSPWTAYGSNIANNNSGFVGIGTTTPGSPLGVKRGSNPDSSSQPSGTFAATIYNATNSPNENGLLIKNNYFSPNSTVLEIGNDFVGGSYTSFMHITGSGGVGVGTAAPVSRLDVNGGISAGAYAGVSAAPSNGLIISGSVGIGTTSPRASLDVNGPITSKPATLNSTSTIDFSTGNLQYTASSCGAFQWNNLKDGGTYSFAVQGTTAATCSFTAYSDAGSTALTVHMPPAHGSTVAGMQTLYSVMVMGTQAYVSWINGY